MTKKRKQFSPHIYAEWGELFDAVSVEQRSELLLAITKFPEYEPKNVPIWNFIKSQLQKDYDNFLDKCANNKAIIQSYWNKKKDTKVIERNTNVNECIPKRITNNELRITNNKKQKIPTLDDIKQYCIDRNNNVNYKQFYDYYSSNDWKDSNNKPIVNWKQKMIAVWEAKTKEKDVVTRQQEMYENV